MLKLKRIGLYLVLPAVLTLLFHAAHPHAHKANINDQDCAVCQTPTTGAKPAAQNLTPTLFSYEYKQVSSPVFLQNSVLASASPRAPPAA